MSGLRTPRRTPTKATNGAAAQREAERQKAALLASPADSQAENSPVVVAGNASAKEELLKTPSKRRKRREDEENAVSVTPTKRRSTASSRVLVTPTKQATTQTIFPPTPPTTPSIRICTSPSVLSTSSPIASCSSSPTSVSCTPSSSSSNIYARARTLLRLSTDTATTSTSKDAPLVGRNIERAQLDAFLRFHLGSDTTEDDGQTNDQGEGTSTGPAVRSKAKALYISGSPGTGKTALLQHVLRQLEQRQKRNRITFLNCTTVHRPDDIWERLADELEICEEDGSRLARRVTKEQKQKLFERSMMRRDGEKCLVVLDEIDHLLPTTTTSKDKQHALSVLFALALRPSSRLILIGIANALDLTQRYFTASDDISFSSSPSMEGEEQEDREDLAFASPQLLHFRPFQPDEMVAIVKSRLQALLPLLPESTSAPEAFLPIIMPAALELAAKKVGAVTGDLRAFLSLLRKAVELFEAEQKKKLASKDDGTAPSESTLASLDARSAPRLTPAHILKATRAISLASSQASSSPSGTNSSSSLSTSSQASVLLLDSKVSELNLQQRLVLTSFVIAVQQRADVPSFATSTASSAPSTISMKPGELHAIYRGLLAKEDVVKPLGSNEFSDLISGLHTRGLVGMERDYLRSSSGRPSALSRSASSSSNLAVPSSSPMLRRSSSSSSTGSRSGPKSPSPSSSLAHSPLLLLYSLPELAHALQSAAPLSAAEICRSILDREDRRMRRMKKLDEMERVRREEGKKVPMEGFSGNGLEGVEGQMVGGRRSRADDEDESDTEAASREDHEKTQGVPNSTR